MTETAAHSGGDDDDNDVIIRDSVVELIRAGKATYDEMSGRIFWIRTGEPPDLKERRVMIHNFLKQS